MLDKEKEKLGLLSGIYSDNLYIILFTYCNILKPICCEKLKLSNECIKYPLDIFLRNKY